MCVFWGKKKKKIVSNRMNRIETLKSIAIDGVSSSMKQKKKKKFPPKFKKIVGNSKFSFSCKANNASGDHHNSNSNKQLLLLSLLLSKFVI